MRLSNSSKHAALFTTVLLLILIAACSPEAQSVEDSFNSPGSSQTEVSRGSSESELVGQVSKKEATKWEIAGKEVKISGNTELEADIEVGDTVKAHLFDDSDGSQTAREIELFSPDFNPTELDDDSSDNPDDDSDENEDDDNNEVKFTGIVEVMGDESWTISGQEITVTSETKIEEGIEVGSEVKVEAWMADDGSQVAHEIELVDDDDEDEDDDHHEVKFTGTVEAMGDESWTISGKVVTVNSETKIEEGSEVGSEVKVEAWMADDGSLVAHEIELVDDDDDDEDDEDEDDDHHEVKFTGTVEVMGNESWTISGQEITVTSETKIEEGIEVGSEVKVEAWTADDGSLVAHEIELVDEDDDDDNDNEVKFTGIVEVMGDESWTISGQVVAVTSETKIEEGIEVGSEVKVEAWLADDGSLVAHEIELVDDDDDDDEDSSDDDSNHDSDDDSRHDSDDGSDHDSDDDSDHDSDNKSDDDDDDNDSDHDSDNKSDDDDDDDDSDYDSDNKSDDDDSDHDDDDDDDDSDSSDD